jgi:hypothetical protein
MAIDFTLTDGQKNNAEGHAIGAMSKVLCGELGIHEGARIKPLI